MDEIAPDIWHWAARHPEWHPGEFGAQVGSYALRLRAHPERPAAPEGAPRRRASSGRSRRQPALVSRPDDPGIHGASLGHPRSSRHGPSGADTLLVDPLFDPDGEPPAGLDAVVAAGHGLLIAITIGYHVRSTAEAWARWGADHTVTILAHESVARRLPDGAPLQAISPTDALPHGLAAQRIGNPRRYEMPIYVPQHRALLVGDAIVVTPEGELRVWVQHELTAQRRQWYRDRLAPSLAGLPALDVERVLVTHGPPVLSDGSAALAAAIAAEPWNG